MDPDPIAGRAAPGEVKAPTRDGSVRQWRGLLRSELGRRLATAVLSSGAIWVAGTAATFGLGVVLARRLGPAGYGVYGTALAVVTLLAVFAQLGLPLLATREVSATRVRGTPADVSALGWCFAAMVAAASAILAAGLWIAAHALPLSPTLRPALVAAAALLPPLSLSALTTTLLRGQERVVVSQLLDVLMRPLLFVGLLLAWPQVSGAGAAISAQVGAATLVALAGFALFMRSLPLVPAPARARLPGWIAAALPMTLLEAMRALEGNYGVLIAGSFASIADAGLLRVALASSVAASLPNQLQTIVVAPFLAGAHAGGERQRLARLVAASTLFMTVAVGAAMLVIAVAGPWLLPFAFGRGFAGSYWPLMMLALNQLLAAAMGPSIILLSMTGEERAVARAFVWSVLAAVAAALLLTPLAGVVGTAASTLVATAIRGVLLNRRARKALGIAPSLLGAIAVLAGGSAPADLRERAQP